MIIPVPMPVPGPAWPVSGHHPISIIPRVSHCFITFTEDRLGRWFRLECFLNISPATRSGLLARPVYY